MTRKRSRTSQTDRTPETDPRSRPRQPEIVCIFGRRGSGKSTLAKKLLEGRRRVIVFDTLGEYQAELTFGLEAPAGRKTPLDLFRYLVRPLEVDAKGEEIVPAPAEFFISYRPGDAAKEFTWICRIARSIGDLTLLCEEVDFFVDPWKLDSGFEQLIRYGRHAGVEMICISRRPAEVNRNLTAQASRLLVFKMHEPRDLAYFRTIIGPEADRIPQLAEFEPLEWRS